MRHDSGAFGAFQADTLEPETIHTPDAVVPSERPVDIRELTVDQIEQAAVLAEDFLCDRIAIINHGRLIANEATRVLVGMAQEKVVEVTVDRDIVAPLDAPCFDKIELNGERTLAITYRKDRVNAGEVLAALQREGLGIVDVSTREADLEDVFLNLTSAPYGG